jgi:hypothetical protein
MAPGASNYAGKGPDGNFIEGKLKQLLFCTRYVRMGKNMVRKRKYLFQYKQQEV